MQFQLQKLKLNITNFINKHKQAQNIQNLNKAKQVIFGRNIQQKKRQKSQLVLSPIADCIPQQSLQIQLFSMLTFDKDIIQFSFIQKSHLKSSLTITNANDQFVFYKFKITQPKYYLIKQEKGTIKPKQTLVIDITLHKDGIPTAGYDKIKCFYFLADHQLMQEPQNFQRRSDTQTHKFTIKVINLPQGFEKIPTEMKESSVKSVMRSQSNFGKTSKNIDSLSLQKQIQQKEQQIVKIKNEMSTIRSTMQKTEVTHKPQPLSALAIWAVMGLVIGVVVGVLWL